MILVTGATGFIGRNFVQEHYKNSHIKILVRRASSKNMFKDYPDILIHTGNLKSGKELESALDGVDVVVHCAALTMGRNFKEFYSANVQATENLIRVMKWKGVGKILFLSSQSAGGPANSMDGVGVSFLPRPVSYYGLSKKIAEDIIIDSDLDFIILRLCSVYGPFDLEILKYIRMLKNGLFLNVGKKEKYINLVYVKDLVSLLVLILQKIFLIGPYTM